MSDPTQQPDERRRFQRVEFACSVILSDDSAQWSCDLLDVSLKGALLSRKDELNASEGDRFALELKLRDDTSIMMDIVIVHMGQERIGCHWEVIDVDSFTHLKRLIEYNTGDPGLLEREIAALAPNTEPSFTAPD